MRKLSGVEITRYSDGDFIIEVEETAKDFSAYIYRKGYGTKRFFYGCPKEQKHTTPPETITKRTFLQLIKVDLDEEKEWYDQQTAIFEDALEQHFNLEGKEIEEGEKK